MKQVILYGGLIVYLWLSAGGQEWGDVTAMWRTNQLPAIYDSRSAGKVPAVKDQGDLGTCWAFASCMALESTLLPEQVFDFSEDHMTIRNSFGLSQDAGGEYTMSMAYLLSWQGPVLEAEDPYGDRYSPAGLKPAKHVQEIQILPEKDYASIKAAVSYYGAVQSSLYTVMDANSSDTNFYNKETSAYYYPGAERPNHDIVIIGWDDQYSRNNFQTLPQQDGAFLCVTSWGNTFGEDGCFYVSYDDINIGRQNIVYTVVEDSNTRDSIYQNDLRGWEGQIGYGESMVYGANVYRSRASERLNAVGFYATKPQTEYEIYVTGGIESSVNLNAIQPSAQGKLKNSGYYTIDLDLPIDLEAGEQFAVIVKIKSPGTAHPLAIGYPEKGYERIDSADGKSYISKDGVTWEATAQAYQCCVCLKAYTNMLE